MVSKVLVIWEITTIPVDHVYYINNKHSLVCYSLAIGLMIKFRKEKGP